MIDRFYGIISIKKGKKRKEVAEEFDKKGRGTSYLKERKLGLSVKDSLGDNSRESKHSKAAVLELVDFVLLQLLRILAESKRIEGIVTRGAIRFSESSHSRSCYDFNKTGPEQNLPQRAAGDSVAVSLNNISSSVNITRKTNSQGSNDDSSSGKHRNSSVLEFGLSEVGNPLRAVGAEFQRIELHIAT